MRVNLPSTVVVPITPVGPAPGAALARVVNVLVKLVRGGQ